MRALTPKKLSVVNGAGRDFYRSVVWVKICMYKCLIWIILEVCVLLYVKSKKISNDQELIQSDPTSCPQNQKGNK